MTPSDEVTMEEVGQSTQLRAGELIIIVVVLIMWAGEEPGSDRVAGPVARCGLPEAAGLACVSEPADRE